VQIQNTFRTINSSTENQAPRSTVDHEEKKLESIENKMCITRSLVQMESEQASEPNACRSKGDERNVKYAYMSIKK
jgi:hypothetical protein